MSLGYRREVDGLRALAIVPVVLFHAELGFPGGFVGVDVFFVISGYLIASQILKEGSAFSLASFWERRVRRIVPAASVMVLACLFAGWLLLLPVDFLRFGRSMIAHSLLVSNVFFWRDLNYFATDEVRPLLHTWSLAVEEQFYVCLPLLFYALRKARRGIPWSLAILALLSFAVSVRGIRMHPSATFYLLPTRGWELLTGCLVAALPGLRVEKRWANEALSVAGLLGILAAASFYQTSTRFPGPAALLPCLGAAAIIVGADTRQTLVGRLLSLRLVVWVGTISYSLYLWHWPILTFARYRLHRISTVGDVLLVALTFVAAWLSWMFVEQPIRRRNVIAERRAIFGTAGLALAASMATGGAIVVADGFSSRWATKALRYAKGKTDSDFRIELDVQAVRGGQLIPLGVEGSGPVELLVWGDSHAMAILHVVDAACREHGLRCLGATHSSTAPLLDFPADGTFSLREDAIPYNRSVLNLVGKVRVKRVLLAAAWSGIESSKEPEFQVSLLKTVKALRDAGAAVAILQDVPAPGFDVPTVLAQTVTAGGDVERVGIQLAEHQANNARADAAIQRVAGSSALVVDPTPSFSDGTGYCRVERDGHSLYFDDHHLSIHGAAQLRPLFEQLLNRAWPGEQPLARPAQNPNTSFFPG